MGNFSSVNDKAMNVELALAVSIVLSNLSNEDDYIKVLLGINQWIERKCQIALINDQPINPMLKKVTSVNEQNFSALFDDDFINKQPEVKRFKCMLNLLSHENPFISEQVSIFLANFSNSPFFRIQFVSDRCMKSLIQILRFHSKNMHTEVSLLAVLIAVLNLSALGDIVNGAESL